MGKCRITFQPGGSEAVVAEGTDLLTAAIAAGVQLHSDCGGDGETSTTAAPPPDLTPLPTATLPATSTIPPSTVPMASTTTTTTTTTLPRNAAPAFGLSQVVFGDNPSVIITNWGNAQGNLEGYWLGQDAVFEILPAIELNPGEQVLIGLGPTPPTDIAGMAVIEHLGPSLGGFQVASGEVGLFRNDSFEDPASLVAYVAWGEHPTAEVAIVAELWGETAVATSEEDPSISTGVFPATTSDDWFTDLGG